MDIIKFLKELFVLILIVDFSYCESICDCSSLMDEQASLKTKINQIELDNVNIKSRLRTLEKTQRHSARPSDQKTSEDELLTEKEKYKAISDELEQTFAELLADSNRQPTPDDAGEEEVRDKTRMDSLEAKISGVESLLKISAVSDTDVLKGSLQSEVLDAIEIKLSSISDQIKDVTDINDANRVVLGNVVRTTLFAEKRRRVHFESVVEKSIEDIKASLNEFKMDSENLVRKHSDAFSEKLEQCTEVANELVATIKQTINEEIQAMNVSLYDVMEDLAETKTGVLYLEDVTINNKKASPMITLAPKSMKVAETMIISFFCKASGFPPPDFQWKKNGRTINRFTMGRYDILTMSHGTVLRIHPVKAKYDNTYFTCVAKNEHGEARASATLTVYDIEENLPGYPRITQNPSLKSVEKEQTATFVCKARAINMDQPTIYWLKDNIPLETADPRLKVDKDGTLSIKRTKESDHGKYECFAENEVGVAYSYTAMLYIKNRRG